MDSVWVSWLNVHVRTTRTKRRDADDNDDEEGNDALATLPHGIHSGLRRDKCYGMFFYFQAIRTDGSGQRHFWRYIDARTSEVVENRFQIARMIACQPDEPRFIGDQDVFLLQEKVIDHILQTEKAVEAKTAAPKTVDPTQQAVAEELKNALRRGTVNREAAKAAIKYLGQSIGRFAIKVLKTPYTNWSMRRDDLALLSEVLSLASNFGKDSAESTVRAPNLQRDALELICFEYLSS